MITCKRVRREIQSSTQTNMLIVMYINLLLIIMQAKNRKRFALLGYIWRRATKMFWFIGTGNSIFKLYFAKHLRNLVVLSHS